MKSFRSSPFSKVFVHLFQKVAQSRARSPRRSPQRAKSPIVRKRPKGVNVGASPDRGGNHKWGFPLHLHVLPYNTFCARAHTHLRKFGYNSNDGAQRALISLERGNRIVGVKEATARRFAQICAERNICINNLANISGVSASTAYSMMRKDRHDISLLTVKKFCDGLGMTLGEFFSTPEFDNLEQEIY